MDFDSRGSKLEKEAAQRRELAKKKKEEELAADKRQKERELLLVQAEVARKAAAEAAQAEAQALAQRELALTGGINFQESSLEPYLLENSEDDKVILPESALHTLNQADAFSKGVLFFQIRAIGGSCSTYTTHCGVREFSASRNKIGLPIKVIESILRIHDPALVTEDLQSKIGLINVKFVRLPKAQYAKLQPLHNLFSSVAAVKEVLEANLRFHATLSEGDLITVWQRGRAHTLKVTEIRSSKDGVTTSADSDDDEKEKRPTEKVGCSLVDTDVVIDLDESVEYQHQRLVQNQQQPKPDPQTQAQAQAQAQTTSSPATVFAPTVAAAAEVLAHVVDRETLRQRRLEALAKRTA